MAHPVESISSIKLAWAVSWSAFWTGFPFKLIVALLLLAGQVHPWEGAGLVTLLVVSVPIDIWAVGLTARTVFLERLGMEVQGPVGVSLWWQGAVLGALVFGRRPQWCPPRNRPRQTRALQAPPSSRTSTRRFRSPSRSR